MKIAPASRVAHHQPRGVKRFQPFIGFCQPGALGWVGQVNPPTFVDDRPDADAGMIPVTFQHASQGLAGAAFCLIAQQDMIRQFRPDQQAHLIGGGVVARVGDFDMHAQAVKSHLFGFAEFIFDVFLRGRGGDQVGVIILVERGAQVEWTTIEQDLPSRVSMVRKPKVSITSSGRRWKHFSVYRFGRVR